MSAIILDVETTDLADDRDVIQLGWLKLKESFEPSPQWLVVEGGLDAPSRWRPRKSISLGAMSVHHIIEDELKDSPQWPGAWPLPEGTEYVVGHSIDFDWKSIGSPAVKRICTLALARKLWPDLDSHSLGALIYNLLPRVDARDRLRMAHDALADAWLCHIVLLAELALMPMIGSWDRLYAASEKARIPTHFTFGKYGPQPGQPGIAISEVRRLDPSYIEWCLAKCDQCQDEYWQRALRGQV